VIKLFGTQLNVRTDLGCITFYLGVLYNFVFQIDWLGNGRKEGRKYAAVRGDQAVLVVVPLQEIVFHLLEKNFVLYLTILIGLLYFV